MGVGGEKDADNIWLSVAHIPGVENVESSRVKLSGNRRDDRSNVLRNSVLVRDTDVHAVGAAMVPQQAQEAADAPKPDKTHPLHSTLSLVACTISEDPSRLGESKTRRQTYASKDGGTRRFDYTPRSS